MSTERIDFPAYPIEPRPDLDDLFVELNQIEPVLEEESAPKNIMSEFLAKFKPEPEPRQVPNPDQSPIFEEVIDSMDLTFKDTEAEDDTADFNSTLAAAIKEVKYQLNTK